MDCVGPLPKTKAGHQYLLTRYDVCFNTFSRGRSPLKHQGQNLHTCLSKVFQFCGPPKVYSVRPGFELHVSLVPTSYVPSGNKSSAYHPESQGPLERFHQTLKNMLRTYCVDTEKEWDDGVHLLLFAAQEALQESLGFSPFELIFGCTVRGPLKLLKETWLDENSTVHLLDHVSDLQDKLSTAAKLAQANLKSSQRRIKHWYDKRARLRNFKPGEKVLVLLPIPGNTLQARYSGPYCVEEKLSDVNYIISTPDCRRQRRLCHINMLKKYYETEDTHPRPKTVTTVKLVGKSQGPSSSGRREEDISQCEPRLKNSDVLENLEDKFHHLSPDEREDMIQLVSDFIQLFSDVPSTTNVVCHDVEIVGDATPCKQHPYRVNQLKLHAIQKEIDYMLENGIIEYICSDWSSPCVLVPKVNGSFRLCTDFRKLNAITKTDSYPLPRIDDCIDRVGHSRYVSKLDLLKGYWQVPLTEKAKQVSTK